MLGRAVHAEADITGFGLAGHALAMAQASGVTLVFEEADLPLLPGALECSRQGTIPGGGKHVDTAKGEKIGEGSKMSGDQIIVSSGGFLGIGTHDVAIPWSRFTMQGTGDKAKLESVKGKVAIVDPGPDDPAHIHALLDAVRNETVTHIFVTHTHRDHSPPAPASVRRSLSSSAVFT